MMGSHGILFVFCDFHSLLPSLIPMSSKCTVCLKAVYPMDPKVNLDGAVFHKECAKCKVRDIKRSSGVTLDERGQKRREGRVVLHLYC